MEKDIEANVQTLRVMHVREQAIERLQSAINTLQRNMYSMECLLERLEEAKDDAERAQVMNSAINHLVCNIQPNLRIDLLANSQAELTQLVA